MELALINEIKRFGLEKTAETYKLSVKDYGHKVLIKYDQIESDMSELPVQDARGIILEKGTWKVMSLAFRKFFNSAETQAAKIDWDSALILEKLDGTLIQLYWDWVLKEWCVGTTGTADGSGEVNNKFGTTFADLFWSTIGKYPGKFYGVDKMSKDERNERLNEFLNDNFCHVFELTTPYNIVVAPHATSNATLLAARNVITLEELSFDNLAGTAIELDVPLVKVFDINASNTGHVIATLEGMPFSEEGYVVVDNKFNRIKIKNPTYVQVHHLKSKTSEHAIMEIVKTNEVEEFAATFPERREEIFKLKDGFDKLKESLKETWNELEPFKPRIITKEENKRFAMAVFDITGKKGCKNHTGLFFSLKDGKVGSVEEYLKDYDNKKLYTEL